MRRRQLWIGFLVVAVGGSIAEAATRPPGGKTTPHRAMTSPRAAPKALAPVRRVRPAVAVKRAAPAKARVAQAAPKARVAAPVPRRTVVAQATPAPETRPVPTPPAAQEAAAPRGPVMISREAEPLMTRALAAYFVTGDHTIHDLRARGWEYGDIAAAGNLAVRSGRPLGQVVRLYEERRDWTAVAREMNVAPEQIYVATNTPRYVMIRPSAQEQEQMEIARAQAAYRQTLEQYQQALARHQAAAAAQDRRLAEASPEAPAAATAPGTATSPGATATTAPSASDAAPGAAALGPAFTSPPYQPSRVTPVERVASARLELAPTTSDALLRRAVAQYYVLHPATFRELEAQGWSLTDVLVAGNLAHRSEASLDEVIALRQGGEEWRAIAERIGVAPEELYQPTMARRITTWERMPDYGNGRRMRDRQERMPAPGTGSRWTASGSICRKHVVGGGPWRRPRLSP